MKRSIVIGNWISGSILSFLLIFSANAHSATILEYLTPTPDSSPTDLAFDAEGNLWFTEINANKIGKLNPEKVEPGTSKGIVEFDLPNANSKPHNIIVAKDGMVWFTEMGGNRIGRLNPRTGKIREYPVPTANSEPHHLAEADDGSIWFLEFETHAVARLDPANGKIDEFKIQKGYPHDLVLVDGKVWYTLGGKFWAQIFFNQIGNLDPKTGKIGSITVPPEKSVPHGLTRTSQGDIWFTQMFANKISKIDLSAGDLGYIEYRVPGKRKNPHDLVVDEKRGWVWFTESRADSIGRLDLAEAKPGTDQGMQEFKIPTLKAHPHELALDREGNVWFTEMGLYFMGKYQNKIGKLVP